MKTKYIIVSEKPTADMPEGSYMVMVGNIYGGRFDVVKTWTGEKTVIAGW